MPRLELRRSQVIEKNEGAHHRVSGRGKDTAHDEAAQVALARAYTFYGHFALKTIPAVIMASEAGLHPVIPPSDNVVKR
jgi:hypothetical protein